MKQNKLLLSLFGLYLVAMGFSSYGQSIKSTYTYDANGNRTHSYVYYLTTSKKSAVQDSSQQAHDGALAPADTSGLPKLGWETSVTDASSGFDIKLYPNPTHGILVLEIAGASQSSFAVSSASIGVWNLQGSQVLKNTVKQFNSFDLSALPTGTYILKLVYNGQAKEYKIVKQ